MPPVRYFHYLFIKQLLVFSSITEKNICKNFSHTFLLEKLHFRKPEKRKQRIEIEQHNSKNYPQTLISERCQGQLLVLAQVCICHATYARGGTDVLKKKRMRKWRLLYHRGKGYLQHLNISNVFICLRSSHDE